MNVVDESVEIVVNTNARDFSCVTPKLLHNITMLQIKTGIKDRNNSHWQGELNPLKRKKSGQLLQRTFRARQRNMPDAHEILNEWAHGAGATKGQLLEACMK